MFCLQFYWNKLIHSKECLPTVSCSLIENITLGQYLVNYCERTVGPHRTVQITQKQVMSKSTLYARNYEQCICIICVLIDVIIHSPTSLRLTTILLLLWCTFIRIVLTLLKLILPRNLLARARHYRSYIVIQKALNANYAIITFKVHK